MDEIDRAWHELQTEGVTDAPLARPPKLCIGCHGRPTRVIVIMARDQVRGTVIMFGYVCNDCMPDLTGLLVLQLVEFAL